MNNYDYDIILIPLKNIKSQTELFNIGQNNVGICKTFSYCNDDNNCQLKKCLYDINDYFFFRGQLYYTFNLKNSALEIKGCDASYCNKFAHYMNQNKCILIINEYGNWYKKTYISDSYTIDYKYGSGVSTDASQHFNIKFINMVLSEIDTRFVDYLKKCLENATSQDKE